MYSLMAVSVNMAHQIPPTVLVRNRIVGGRADCGTTQGSGFIV